MMPLSKLIRMGFLAGVALAALATIIFILLNFPDGSATTLYLSVVLALGGIFLLAAYSLFRNADVQIMSCITLVSVIGRKLKSLRNSAAVKAMTLLVPCTL